MIHIAPKELSGPLIVWGSGVDTSKRQPDGRFLVTGDDEGYVNNDGNLYHRHGVGAVHIISGHDHLLVSEPLRDVLATACGSSVAFHLATVEDFFNRRRAEKYQELIAPELQFDQIMSVDTNAAKVWRFKFVTLVVTQTIREQIESAKLGRFNFVYGSDFVLNWRGGRY